MFKKIFLTLILITGMSAFAADNYLNSVVISNDGDNNSIILRSDEVTKVKKEVEGTDLVILTLKSISQSAGINTFYKNTSDVKGLIVQNDGNKDLKVYVEAPNIAKADVVFETPNAAPVKVADSVGEKRMIWALVSLGLLFAVMYSAKNIAEKPVKQPDINEIIKEREKALYRNFQKELASVPSINYKLKGYRKHVLKGETIRSYESKMSTKA